MMLNGDSCGDQEYVPPTAPVEVGVVSPCKFDVILPRAIEVDF